MPDKSSLKKTGRPKKTVPKKKSSPKQRGCGLTKPFPVSTSLCSFMSVPEGSQMARAEVTKYLHNYIKEHDLYDSSNRQYIIPDNSLKELFSMNDDSPVHIFSVQKIMNTHFLYSTSAASASTSAPGHSPHTSVVSSMVCTPVSGSNTPSSSSSMVSIHHVPSQNEQAVPLLSSSAPVAHSAP